MEDNKETPGTPIASKDPSPPGDTPTRLTDIELSAMIAKIDKVFNSPYEKLVKGLNILSAFLMVGVTAFLVYFAHDQSGLMNKSIKETQDMNRVTKDLTEKTVEYTKQQAEASKVQAKSSKLSATAAMDAAASSKNSANIAEQAFTVGERPYVGVSDYAIDNLTAGQKPIIHVTIGNFGKIPAVDVTAWVNWRVDPAGLQVRDFVIGKTLSEPSQAFMPQGVPKIFKNTASKEISSSEISDLNEHKLIMYVFGIANYGSPAGHRYLTRFCALYEPKDKTFVMCSSHNDIE